MTDTLSPNNNFFYTPARLCATQDDVVISIGSGSVFLQGDAGLTVNSASIGETRIQFYGAPKLGINTTSHTEIIASSPQTNLGQTPFLNKELAVGFTGKWVERYVSAIEGFGDKTSTPPSTYAIRSACAIVKLLWSSGKRKPERVAATSEGVIVWLDTARFDYYLCYNDGRTMTVRDDDEWRVDPSSGEIDDFSHPESPASFEMQLLPLAG